MNISREEQRAIAAVLEHGERFGYGNLISHLQTAWAQRLMQGGLSERAARAATASDGRGYPFAMQRDLVVNGEWDETGK
jgi:hypothetical protein